jgi:hypothetical protein
MDLLGSEIPVTSGAMTTPAVGDALAPVALG